MPNMEKYVNELANDSNVLNDIKIIKNGLIQMRNNINSIIFTKEISKGVLIRLNCGHNVIFSGKEENMVVEILEKVNFLKWILIIEYFCLFNLIWLNKIFVEY